MTIGRSLPCVVSRSCTVGLPISDMHTDNQFANEPEGLRHFRDHRWKALSEENPDLSGPFCLGIILKVILNNFQNNA